MKMIIVKEKESKKFIRDFNKNKVSKEFLDSCKKADKLFVLRGDKDEVQRM